MRARCLPVLAAATLLCGCGGGAGLVSGISGDAAPEGVSIPGRWMLTAPNAPPCGLELRQTASGQGLVAPDGGCPGHFYRSRRWAFESGALVIMADDGDALGRLSYADNTFEGRSTAGQAIRLSPVADPQSERRE